MAPRIRTVCSWCKAILVDAPPGPEGEVTHGICEACLRAHQQEYGLTDEDIEEALAEAAAERRGRV